MNKIEKTLLYFGFLAFSYSTIQAQQWDTSTIIWEELAYEISEMPSSIKIFHTNTILTSSSGSQRRMKAWYAEIDVSDENLIFDSVIPEDGRNITTSKFAHNSDKKCYLAINGGYFGSGLSYSLVMSDGVELAENIRAVNRNGRGYWLTRGAFGIDYDRNMEVKWTFSDPELSTPWAYNIPSPNNRNEEPQQKPNSEFPESTSQWLTKEAIGGAPVLIKNGEIITDYEPELLQDGFDTNAHPRTAIGYTSDNKMILFVVDGRTAASGGISLYTLADILFGIGCVEALNLDGGGSSTFVANYEVLNSPSDGSERSVYSAFLVKDKTKVTLDNENYIKQRTNVYPNPVENNLKIENKSLKHISILCIDGKVVNLASCISENNISVIDQNLIPKGVSILRLEESNGKIEYIKLYN